MPLVAPRFRKTPRAICNYTSFPNSVKSLPSLFCLVILSPVDAVQNTLIPQTSLFCALFLQLPHGQLTSTAPPRPSSPPHATPCPASPAATPPAAPAPDRPRHTPSTERPAHWPVHHAQEPNPSESLLYSPPSPQSGSNPWPARLDRPNLTFAEFQLRYNLSHASLCLRHSRRRMAPLDDALCADQTQPPSRQAHRPARPLGRGDRRHWLLPVVARQVLRAPSDLHVHALRSARHRLCGHSPAAVPPCHRGVCFWHGDPRAHRR